MEKLTRTQREAVQKLLAKWKRESVSATELAKRFDYDQLLKEQYLTGARTINGNIKDVEELFEL